jgi:hypothetical protein
MNLKYFRFVIIYIFLSQSFTYACDQKQEWTCVFPEPNSYSAHNEDPFKERACLVDCDAVLKQRFFSHTKEDIKLFDRENQKVIKVGSFIIDERLLLGYGDSAYVYLAYQPSTDMLFAAKRMYDCAPYTLKEGGDYISLKKLDRLYGVYQKVIGQHDTVFFVFLPFGGVRSIDGAPSFLKEKSMSENLTVRQSLVDALLTELSYLASRGVWHLDQRSEHYMGGLQYKHIMAIDLDSILFDAPKQTQTSISEDIYGVTRVHQGIIHRLIIGESYEHTWKAYITEQLNQSEDSRKGMEKFKQFFRNDSDAGTHSLTKAKLAWKEFKKYLSDIKE